MVARVILLLHLSRSSRIPRSFAIHNGRTVLRNSRRSSRGHRIPHHLLRTGPGCLLACSGAAEGPRKAIVINHSKEQDLQIQLTY